jgi:CBS domain containing-hemolysin-like protein
MSDNSSMLIALVLLLVNSLLAAARSALVSASRTRLRQGVEQGQAGARLALAVAEDATPLIATVRLAQALCRFFAAGVIATLFEPLLAAVIGQWPAVAVLADSIAFFILLLLSAVLVVGLGELVPEAWVLRAPERWAIFFAPGVRLLEWVLNPVVRLMLWTSGRVARPLAGRQLPLVTEEEIKTLVDAGEEGGVLEEEEKEMIYSIFEIGDTMAREIMVPRMDVLAPDERTTPVEAVDVALKAGHSRIPIYRDNIDNIVGLLYVKDLLRAWQEGNQFASLNDLKRPAYFVPETKKVDELLAELQQKRIHLAVVVDEYGGTAGIVTMEDIVEEIVGEIRDEYDVNEESLFEKVSDAEYVFDARIDMDEVNELLALDLPSTESDSLGGFIYGQLGHVPVPGERVAPGPAEFEVLSVTGRRIRKVRAVRLPGEAPAKDNARGAAEPGDDEARRGNGKANGGSHAGAAPSEVLNDNG